MDSASASPGFDPNALTFRTYLSRSPQPSSTPPSIPVIPSYQELAVLQQELLYLSEKATQRHEKYTAELSRLEGGSALPSKDSSVSSTPTSSVSGATFSATGQGLSLGMSGGVSVSTTAARASASPITSSPSSVSGSVRTGGSLGSVNQTSGGGGSPSVVKLGVVTLKLKRSDAAESSKTDDEQSAGSTPNTIKIRTGTPSLAQDGFLKKQKKRDLDEDSEYSEDDRAPKSKRSDEYSKSGRSLSPPPAKLIANRQNSQKPGQSRIGDKAHSSSHQKKKKNETQKSQKPAPKSEEVQEDFSKVKVANQVPIQTFWASMEPYFRPFTESDRTVLEEEGDQVTPLLIPPLGKHYIEAWAEEDRALMPYDGYESRRSSVDLTKDQTPSRNTVYSQPFELTDENIEQDEVSCGPLTERIICSLIAEDVVDPTDIKQDEDSSSSSAGTQSNARNYAELEERLKRELRFVGLLGDEEIDWDAREDDEISIALRSYQKELREVIRINRAKKQRLLGLVNNHLAFQEYNTILDDLDKQVEQGYLKRFRMTKSKKKKTSTPKSLSENALSSMDRRRRFVQGVGPIFPAENYTIPTKSIYPDDLESKAASSAPLSYRQLNGLL
ncbi:Transcriptional regulator [Dissophora globulifera]|uniref:Transcriptional regulator n=1 Tax=Dissophora globulifera TaxID=979702 RepID=A0A9P6RSI2_9FUNG|nr:Transcriptional regulator [Dissophora globulifera]